MLYGTASIGYDRTRVRSERTAGICVGSDEDGIGKVDMMLSWAERERLMALGQGDYLIAGLSDSLAPTKYGRRSSGGALLVYHRSGSGQGSNHVISLFVFLRTCDLRPRCRWKGEETARSKQRSVCKGEDYMYDYRGLLADGRDA